MTDQMTLPWPAAAEKCPRCRGAGDVYYVRQSDPTLRSSAEKDRVSGMRWQRQRQCASRKRHPMTIVTYRHRPKRPAKPAQAATIKVERIVQHTPRGRAWTLREPDPEGYARAVEFLSRMIRPKSD